MELKAYLAVLARRWWLVVLVPALVFAGVVAQFLHGKPTYVASTQVSIVRNEQQPNLNTQYTYDDYYALLASEFALDDLVMTVKGNVFADDVAAQIKQDTGKDIAPKDIQQEIGSGRIHRILTIDVSDQDPDRAVLIASTAAKTLEAKGLSYFKLSDGSSVSIQTIDVATKAKANTTKRVVMYMVQLLLAVFAGLVLAFFVDYLDDTLRGVESVSGALGLPVLGTIPGEASA